MSDPQAITPEMEVYGADGVHVGSVDTVGHARITLNTVASSVPVDGGQDHYVLLHEVARVEGNRVHMTVAGAESVHPRAGGPAEHAEHAERGAMDPDAILNREG